MLGLMQDWPLLCHRIIDHAATQSRRAADRRPLDRRPDPPHQLCRSPRRALRVAQRLDRDGIKLGDRVATLAWNTWRHMESLVRDHGHRRGLPHAEPAAVPRPALLHHQPRRRSRAVHRPHLPAAHGEARRQAADHRALHHVDRRGAHAGDDAAQRRCLRALARRSRRRLRLGRVRREHRRRPLLHLGHHRQSQGRALLAPLQLPAHAGRSCSPT